MTTGFEVQRTAAFDRWLSDLPDVQVKFAVQARLERLARGLWGDSKPVGSGLTELRIHLGSGWRVYVTERAGRMIVVLGGGTKRRQAADIAEAQARAKEVD